MLTWMPSGAFQIKIVDFGLATMIHNQSQEELEKLESVYGSVFFMPPEQFERKVLDVRSDLYSLGCCFYQALAGSYPFDGDTGVGVMHSHLHHTVRPVEETTGFALNPESTNWTSTFRPSPTPGTRKVRARTTGRRSDAVFLSPWLPAAGPFGGSCQGAARLKIWPKAVAGR